MQEKVLLEREILLKIQDMVQQQVRHVILGNNQKSIKVELQAEMSEIFKSPGWHNDPLGELQKFKY